MIEWRSQKRQLHATANSAGKQGETVLPNLGICLVEQQPHLLFLPGKDRQCYSSSSHGHKQNCLRMKQEKWVWYWCRFSLHISLINDWSIPYHFIQAIWHDCLQAAVWMERKISLMWALSASELMWHYLNVLRNHLLLWFVDIKVCSENCSNLSVILMISEQFRQTCTLCEDLIITLSAFFFLALSLCQN